jgi:hypothetical protein
MIREKIKHTDFLKIAKENEYFLWHFLQKNQNLYGNAIYSWFDKGEKNENQLKDILENCNVPYFESYTEDSIDFLAGLGFDYKLLYTTGGDYINVPNDVRFRPIMIGFKKFGIVKSTFEICYCSEGVIDILSKMNPKFIEELMENLEKTPD